MTPDNMQEIQQAFTQSRVYVNAVIRQKITAPTYQTIFSNYTATAHHVRKKWGNFELVRQGTKDNAYG